jgi:hypothetical protein
MTVFRHTQQNRRTFRIRRRLWLTLNKMRGKNDAKSYQRRGLNLGLDLLDTRRLDAERLANTAAAARARRSRADDGRRDE